MNLIRLALRRPITLMVAIVGIALGCVFAVRRMGVDIFPNLNLPVIYVAQPYGGMDPSQMEGFLTNYYEYHFLYNTGIHHVESKNIQGMALIKLVFHPDTDMAQAMAETINYVNRSRAFMPPGTVAPFVIRFDVGSVPVGKLVFSTETRSIADVQDLAIFRVRPLFAALPGVSAPPAFGGSARTIVVTANPERLRSYGVSSEELIAAIAKGNAITPSGNIPVGDSFPIVRTNSIVRQISELREVPIRPGVYLRDMCQVSDTMDVPSGYALVNGRRSVFIQVTKRSTASTLDVVKEVKRALPDLQKALPDDVKVRFEFDQSPFVTRAINSLTIEAVAGAVLVGLMVLLFLRDWRSAIVVMLNIPLALMFALVALWLTGQTINLMTLGGLALAVGMLVDEATVAIENIHRHMERNESLRHAVRDGTSETAIPRLLAMLCILAVFLSSFFMQGAPRTLFVPLSLAVGFSMLGSYLLSSTFVPVLCIWLLRHAPHEKPGFSKKPGFFSFDRWRASYQGLLARLIRFRVPAILAYLAVCVIAVWAGRTLLGMEIFPKIDSGQFRLKIKAPPGSHIDYAERVTLDTLDTIEQLVGKDQIDISLAYVGAIPSSYPINAVYHWSGGSHEATLWVALRRGSGWRVDDLQRQLRSELSQRLPNVQFSFEPADIISDVMSFGSPTPVEVSVHGSDYAAVRAHAAKLKQELAAIPALPDLQYAQTLDYPSVEIKVDRMKAGTSGVTPDDVGRAVLPGSSSTRFVFPIFWPEPKSGVGYQVQLELPRAVVRPTRDMPSIRSPEDLKLVPVRGANGSRLLVQDVAEVTTGTVPGEIDRYSMRREVSLIANVEGADLGSAAQQINAAIARAGELPPNTKVEIHGQIAPMNEILGSLLVGVLVAVVAIFLLLAANFQSLRLALVTVSTAPGVIAGVVLMLLATRTTLNIQSFIGAIMAVGVAMANAILLVTFAEQERRQGRSAREAATLGASSRLRAILMTSCAMMAGMLPMALGIGEFGQQNAPLGRAVVGGLAFGTLTTLLVLPGVFSLVQARASTASASLDPDEPRSAASAANNW